MSEPRNGYRAWQEGGPNETKHGGPWFVSVPDGGDIEIGYDANGKPDEYHARLFASAEALMDFMRWVETWTSNPVGAYSVSALDGLFGMTRDKIAAINGAVGTGKETP